MRARDFEDLRDQFEREGQWAGFFGVTSLEGLRMTDFERTLVETGVPFDLVIVDEGHHLRNPATRSFALGEVLSDQSDHLLLLSATPIQTGQSDLLSLLQLVDPAEFQATSLDDLDALLEPNRYINGALARLSRPAPDLHDVAEQMRGALRTRHGESFAGNAVFTSWLRRIEDVPGLTPEATVQLRRDLQRMHTLAPYYSRTRKREVEEAAERQAMVLHVELTPGEQDFYDAWVEFLIARARARNPEAPPGWAITQFERMAASSLQAARVRLDALISELDVGDDYEGTDPDLADDARGLAAQPVALETAVSRVRAAADMLPDRDSKLDRFLELIGRLLAEKPDRKILVFTFFRSTLRYVVRCLRDAGVGCASIWGDDTPEQRGEIIDGFRASTDASVLVSTEVGSEGLDFQFCDVVVNYDLPWNPMRVEQRIGRIDRYGQREPRVVVASFFARETIDTRILERLYERIGVFEESIGELEPILGPAISELQADAFTRGLTAEQQEQRAHDAVLRIEQRKQDMDEFESARAELMGQGELLNQEIESIQTSGRYVSPAETKALVQRWLHRVDLRHGQLRPTNEDSVLDLEVSDAGVARVRHHMVRRRITHPNALRLMQRIQDEHHAWVTFDSEVSGEHEGLPFLHTGHPLVLTAIEELQADEPPGWIARIGSFVLPADAVDERTRGGIALAVYRLGLHGIDSQESLLPVAVSLGTQENLDDLADYLLGALSESAEAPPPSLDELAITNIEGVALELVEARRREIEELERGQLAARIAVRRATLERTYAARITRAVVLRDQAMDERIVRLHGGRARNLQAELDQRVHELTDIPEPAAEVELLAMAIFSLRDADAGRPDARPPN